MLIHRLSTSIATLGVGKIPKAPGTWGSLVAAVVWWLWMPEDLWVQGVLIVCAFFVGWWAADHYEKRTQKHDPKEIVVDELFGMWITLFGAHLWGFSWLTLDAIVVVGFLFFRLFDIWKPFPVGWIDKNVPGALGTLLDDGAAGIMAGFALFICSFFL